MKIPVLMYHELTRKEVDNAYTVREKDFLSHLEYLKMNGYRPLLVEEYCRALGSSDAVSGKSVIITFDDGHESDYSIALPALKRFNFRANFFITTDFIGRPGYMKKEELLALKKAGMSVQSHAKTHRFLNELTDEDLRQELEGSRKVLEGIIGEDVLYISFPGGRYDKNVIEAARMHNYSAFFSSVPFSFKKFGDACLVGRYGVKTPFGRDRFMRFMELNSIGKSMLRGDYYLKFFLKKLLGNRIYHSLWKKYISRAAVRG